MMYASAPKVRPREIDVSSHAEKYLTGWARPYTHDES